ncbi:MAG TPA: flavocytochrome c [Terriglobales bacterium]|nr:flavocytochrome c [Terriglobales bacterium]
MRRNRTTALLLALVFALGLTAGAASYTVVPGDVLWKIAEKFGTDYKTLAAYNGIENPNLIFPGQIIKWDEAAPAPVPTPEPEPEPEPEPIPEPEPEPEPAGMKAGTYTAKSSGMWGDIPVTVTVSETAITAITVGSNIETPGLRDWPVSLIPDEIIEHQSVAVDTVTGATFTSMGIIRAVTGCLTQAGADMAVFGKVPEKAKATDITRTADVIIVGGGGAGLAAACSATEQGASVILIEKMGTLGGNSIVSGGIYNAADPAEQEPLGIEDSPAFHAQQTWEGGDKIANKELVDMLCNSALDGLNWLKGMGMEFKPGVTQGVGSLYRRTHSAVMPNGTGYIKTFLGTLDSRGALSEIMTDTTGKSLIVENGRVVGVNALGKDGNKVTLKANKGVIIATGGFAGNVDLRVEYCQGEKWPDLGAGLITSNMPGVTGDGIFMARDIGAALVDMEQIQLLQVCNPWTGVTSDVLTGGVDTCVYVNQEGNRFVREDGRRDVISAAILKQTDGRMYTIHNFTLVDNPDTFKALGGRTVTELIGEGKYGFVSGATLEELAQKLDVPYENLKASIDAYNAHVEAGDAVDEFGRELLTTALEGGPWYAYPRAPAAHHTMGGIKIDVSTHVIGTDGAVIPGLYAAGEVTGGIHGGNRLGGNAIVDFTVFGRIAGKSAASGK